VASFPSLKIAPTIPVSRVIRLHPAMAADNPYVPWVEVVQQALPITEYDEAILEYVEELEVKHSSSPQTEEWSLVFRFAPEVLDYFEDESLSMKFIRDVRLLISSPGH
jgi:hypothetical protein